ncbi:F-box/LRR-repeat protein [Candidatus Odyssella thessalonicensis]|uniref:F-box/LRR-repeat protein n=1 Tax=Candidatus Odyssella thessalonicensis TaxID=84647 RepID=UPI000225A8A7|nr:F-box/LRR-repeat protein [Candidatus Odyssella thessalonicensis]
MKKYSIKRLLQIFGWCSLASLATAMEKDSFKRNYESLQSAGQETNLQLNEEERSPKRARRRLSLEEMDVFLLGQEQEQQARETSKTIVSLDNAGQKTLLSLSYDLPNELLFQILKLLPKSDLKENARLVSSAWCQVATELLSKSTQTLIKTRKDLKKFLHRHADGRLVNPYKLSHLAIDFLPDEKFLNVLKDLTPPIDTITVAAPTEWNQEQDKIETAKSLLENYPNLNLRFHYERYYTADYNEKPLIFALYGWNSNDLSQLWNSLGNSSSLFPTSAQSQMLSSLATHPTACCPWNLDRFTSWPFYTNYSIICEDEQARTINESKLPLYIEKVIKFINDTSHLRTLSLKKWPLGSLPPQTLISLVETLGKHPNLTSLDLRYTNLERNEENIRILSRLFQLNTGLVSVNLLGMEFSSSQISILSQALTQAKSLKYLKLDYSDDKHGTTSGIAALIPTNGMMVKLDFTSNHMVAKILFPWLLTDLRIHKDVSVDSVQALLKIISAAPNFQKLDLTDGHYGDAIGTEIATLVKTNRTITSLKAGQNRFSQETAKLLAEALASNTVLRKLELFTSPLGSKGIRFLAKALRKNRALQWLDLSCTMEENENEAAKLKAVQAMACALTHNTTLKVLNLAHNSLLETDIAIFLTSLTTNHTLESLIVGPFENDTPIMDVLELVLKTNKSLEYIELLRRFNMEEDDEDEWVETLEQTVGENTTLRCLAVRMSSEDLDDSTIISLTDRTKEMEERKPHLYIIATE